MTLRVAIVGCGKIADGHVEEIQKLPELATIVAVCDLEELMAEQIATRYGLPATYTDFERLLERERPDVVHVTTPPAAHLPLAKLAVDAGCHVFVEKPLTPTLSEAHELVAHVERAGKKLTAGWTHFFDPPALKLRALLEEGVLGQPVHAESFYGYDLSGAFGKALLSSGEHWVHRLPGKLLQNTIDHMFNKVVELFDDAEPEVIATGFKRREQRFGDVRDELHDELRLIVRGETMSAYGTFSSHIKPVMQTLRVYGTENTAQLDFSSRTVTLEATASLPSAVGRVLPAFEQAYRFAREGAENVWRFAKSDFHFFAGLQELIARFYRAILDDGPPPISHQDILKVCSMHEQTWAQLAAREGRP
ncbi:MAG TPA: Gfo/Idh/MocA family oxidoreductase [Polyangiaceae bacterium]|nr:Gfo/Idh/MocA family oxidoreductase [Polyangiaceae bacterium]